MKTKGLLVIVSLAANAAHAWDGGVTGKIYGVDVTDAGNYAFRVILQGYPTLCSNGSAWAYLDDSNANYKTYVAAILSAKASGETVTLYTTRDASGFCKIGYIATVAVT